jgi:catechol 2,3-dioxygenase-like lactoylglutathione lyase family enzyme
MAKGMAIPILPARDLAETRAFYERLGFETVGWWPDTFGGYAVLTRGGLEMHFFHHAELAPLANYAQCYWRVDDVDTLYRDLGAAGVVEAGVPRRTAPADRPWGMRELALVDPNGNLVRVGQPLRNP